MAAIDDELLRQECVRRAAWLLEDPPATLHEMRERTRARLAEARGREIRVVVGDPGRIPMPTGMWIPDDEIDVIWVDSRTSPMHRAMIEFHEYGHLIWAHSPTPLGTPAAQDQRVRQVAADCPVLSPAKVAALMGRCGGTAAGDLVERQAEVMGRVLLARASQGPSGGLRRFLSCG